MYIFFFFSSRRRHTRFLPVSWARRCVQETGSTQSTWAQEQGLLKKSQPKSIEENVYKEIARIEEEQELEQNLQRQEEDQIVESLKEEELRPHCDKIYNQENSLSNDIRILGFYSQQKKSELQRSIIQNQ
eukprot:TRINITY_DN15638_c0_g1_i1.p2 TRINITY_DN15638_c0_g1~~TRINITY_DN15638_c0_g1_i1.p2  ORF type:complete len:130 (+),score=27.68 TRINITY_DN15638_c0_g1_i1:7-396(+)